MESPAAMDADLLCVRLSNDVRMPTMAYSVTSAEIGGTTMALETALQSGFRHIVVNTVDKNELEVGHVIRRWTENKKLSREDLFLTVKMSFDEGERINLKSRFVQTLYTLSCDYVDLLILDMDSLQCHRKSVRNNDIHATGTALWKSVAGLQRERSVRAAGIVCNDDDLLVSLFKRCDPTPQVLNLNYCDSLNTRTFQSSAAICRKYSIQALIDIDELDRIQDINNTAHDKILREMSNKIERSQEQVLARSCLDRGMAVVARFSDRKAIRNSFKVFDFSIQRQDLLGLFRTVV